jgi:transcriptional regulator with XRE-family HTH domain
MSSQDSNMKAIKTRNAEYQTITAVSVDINALKITFTFQDGDVVTLPFSVVASDGRLRQIQWERAAVAEHGLFVVVPAEPESLEIPWDIPRRLADQDFARALANHASAQAGYIGSRLRELRLSRGLKQAQLAVMAGVQPASLSRIENGHFDISASTMWRLLAAMGCSPADLASPQARTVAAKSPVQQVAEALPASGERVSHEHRLDTADRLRHNVLEVSAQQLQHSKVEHWSVLHVLVDRLPVAESGGSGDGGGMCSPHARFVFAPIRGSRYNHSFPFVVPENMVTVGAETMRKIEAAVVSPSVNERSKDSAAYASIQAHGAVLFRALNNGNLLQSVLDHVDSRVAGLLILLQFGDGALDLAGYLWEGLHSGQKDEPFLALRGSTVIARYVPCGEHWNGASAEPGRTLRVLAVGSSFQENGRADPDPRRE